MRRDLEESKPRDEQQRTSWRKRWCTWILLCLQSMRCISVEWTHHCLFQLMSHKPGFCYNPHWVSCNLAPNAVCSFSPFFNDSDIYSFLFHKGFKLPYKLYLIEWDGKVTKTSIWKTHYHDPRKAASMQLPVNDTGTKKACSIQWQTWLWYFILAKAKCELGLI